MLIIGDIANKLEKKYQQKYGVAVFDIDLEETKNGVEIKGEVLVKGHRESLLSILKENSVKIKKENIKILSDVCKRYEIGWAIVRIGIIDLKFRYVSNKIINEKILKRIRCSQAFRGEILRVLYKNEDQLLVQQNDLTLGWVNRKDLVLKKKSLYKEWKKGNYAIKGKMIKIPKTNCHSKQCNTEHSRSIISGSVADSRENSKRKKILKQVQNDGNLIVKEAEEYLDTKYVLGGKSEKGIDCSGLVQIAYKNSFNIILPRHSWDQKEMGIKIRLDNVRSGDLIFLIKKSDRHRHVGIVDVVLCESAKRIHSSEAENMEISINLIHASLDLKKVVRQNLENVLERYEFVEARRIME
ncbi:MAG: NlpC/P60 family protein [Patescibacteria group bacterium]|nr:NlpC/P60 family protein [Patescibacteria group bacterium]